MLGNSDESIRDFSTAIELSSNPYAYNSRGEMFLSLGKINEATRDFQKVLELDPNNELALKNLQTLREKKAPD